MNILLKVGYEHILFPSGCDFNNLMASFAKAYIVREAGTWDNRLYEIAPPKESAKIDLSIIPDGMLVVNNVSEEPVIAKMLELQEKVSQKDLEIYRLKAQLLEVQKTLSPKLEK